MRRGFRIPDWYLLLLVVLGIMSSYLSLRNLESFAIRHHRVLSEALDTELMRPPSDSDLQYVFSQPPRSQVLQQILISCFVTTKNQRG